VLKAARRTVFYSARLRHPVETLANLPPIALPMFLENREKFTNPRARPAFASIDRLHSVANGWRAKLGFPVEAITGPQAALARFAAEVEAGAAAPVRGARRVLVYTTLGDPLLCAGLRERLWQAFELPVFEQLRGLEGELLASECEAQEGLHLETGTAIFEGVGGELVVTSLVALHNPVLRLRTGWAGRIEPGVCSCGSTVARFLPASIPPAVRKPPSLAQEIRVAEPRFAAALQTGSR
jgi:hypothetical protein